MYKKLIIYSINISKTLIILFQNWKSKKDIKFWIEKDMAIIRVK